MLKSHGNIEYISYHRIRDIVLVVRLVCPSNDVIVCESARRKFAWLMFLLSYHYVGFAHELMRTCTITSHDLEV